MLTVLYPEILPIVQSFPIGLLPISIRGESRPKLIIKAPKEGILAAKVNHGFKIYIAPVTLAGEASAGLVSAFFDNEDEPLVIYTPLFDDDLTPHLIQALTDKSLDVYFFDELNRELLGYTSNLVSVPTSMERLKGSSFREFDLELAISAHDQLRVWFGTRSSDDDLAAVTIEFTDSLVPEDIFILDTRPENHSYRGSSQFSFTELERDEPGRFQEYDIANLLKGLFSAGHIFMNPLRIEDHEEIADLIVITETDIVVIQAKDSPNIERVLRNPIARKKLTTIKALSKANKQMRGAIRYLRSMSPVKMFVASETIEIDISGLCLRGLIVVKELFNDEYSVYSPQVLELSKDVQVPCITLDYPELQSYVTKLSSQEAFFHAFDKVFLHGVETGMFPRLRIW